MWDWLRQILPEFPSLCPRRQTHGPLWVQAIKTKAQACDEKVSYPVELFHKITYRRTVEELDLIWNDVPRTLPGDPSYYYARWHLRKLLMDYSKLDPIIGYRQGMNELGLVLRSELSHREALWALMHLCISGPWNLSCILPPYALTTELCEKFDAALVRHRPELGKHLHSLQLYSTLYSEWFVTVFAHIVPGEELRRLWDRFLVSGWPPAFSFGIALLMTAETELLECKDLGAALKTIKSLRYAPFRESCKWPEGVLAASDKIEVSAEEANWISGASERFDATAKQMMEEQKKEQQMARDLVKLVSSMKDEQKQS